MKILTTIQALQEWRLSTNTTIGFVPTMGALHAGHLSLIEKAKSEVTCCVVSIFINPTQFLAGEDYTQYPKKLEADFALCERAGVDVVFVPNTEEMYRNEMIHITVKEPLGFILEGHFRPTHFDGVARIVLKLFHLVQPHRAYFGKKDAQQVAVIHSLVNDLFLPITLVECDTLREKDGLAMSSRNVYLCDDERHRALTISRALSRGVRAFGEGIDDVNTLKTLMYEELDKSIRLDYLEIVTKQFHTLTHVERGNTLLLIAGRIGTTRLIDNMEI